MKISKKLLVSLIVVVIVAVLGMLAYLNWSKELGRGIETQGELKGFRTYNNENLGISLSYPNDWTEGTLSSDKEVFNLLKDQNQITLDLLGPFKCLCTGKELEQIIVSNTIFDGSGLNPKSINEFKKVNYNGNVFYKIRTGRFEGVLSYSYYLPLQNKVLVFSFVSYGVDWTNPNLDEENDSSHLVLKQILSTVKIGEETKKEDISSKIDTSNWKTYRNEKYGFEIKYPANWIIDFNPITGMEDIDEADRLFCPSEFSNGVGCKFIDNSPHMPSKIFAVAIFQKNEPLSISPNPDYKILGHDLQGKYGYELYLADHDYNSVFDQMVKTFKFISKDESKAIDTSNWKTYRNEKYGFELKYPLSWKIEENHLTNQDSLYSFSLVSPSTQDFFKKNPGTDALTYDIAIVLYELNYRGDYSRAISTPIFFNGIQGEKIFYKEDFGLEDSIYLDGKIYSYEINSSERNKDETEKILSTFKFIDTKPISEKPVLNLKPCFVGGCSGELCLDAKDSGMASTCEWKEEYACYKKTKCERQSTGQCGWTETPEFKSCLANPLPKQ